MSVRILCGDVREVLPTLASDSVHCCVTSPPYWGLRSYLPADHPEKHKEIGSEPTLQEWVQTMVEVFREVRRVLRPDGTLWLNLGDAYASNAGGYTATGSRGVTSMPSISAGTMAVVQKGPRVPPLGLKPKDLMGQPWRVAFALQDDGWWLRQEIIWHKPNPMPESIRDRCTKAHEHVFLLSKSERYFYDFEAAREPASSGAWLGRQLAPAGWATGDTPHTAAAHQTSKHHRKVKNNGVGFGHGFDAEPKERVTRSSRRNSFARTTKASEGTHGQKPQHRDDREVVGYSEMRNPRSVWTIPTHPFKGAHFATFPPALAERCITAGCPTGGTVLDPFGGSGTVGLEADRQHKDAILIDLDERNVPMATERIIGESSLFAEIKK